MPSGSKAWMRAPAAARAGRMARLGASRMSSVLGLKVRPSTARVLPARLPPQAAMILSAIRRLRAWLTSTTVSTIASATAASRAVRTHAVQSLGKDDPAGAHEIGDRRALAQKFRVRGDIEPTPGPGAAQDLGDLAPGADRDGRLGHHHRITAERPAHRLGGGIDIGQIGMPVAAPRRR